MHRLGAWRELNTVLYCFDMSKHKLAVPQVLEVFQEGNDQISDESVLHTDVYLVASIRIGFLFSVCWT